MALDWQSLNSSNLDAAAYDNEAQELYVRFKSGRTYVYQHVPQDIAEGLFNASSPGFYLNADVKGVYASRPG